MALLTTHHHLDHCAGNEELLANDDGYAPPTEPHVSYGPADDRVPGLTQSVRPGDSIEVEAHDKSHTF